MLNRNHCLVNRIRREIFKQERAEYGEQAVEALSKILTAEYGRGYSRKSLLHMIRFAEVFPEEQIVSTLSRQLAWSHFLEITYLLDLRGEYESITQTKYSTLYKRYEEDTEL